MNGWQYIVSHTVNVTQKYIRLQNRLSIDCTFICRYNLGFYNATATMEQGLSVVHLFKLSDSQDSYINMIYDNVNVRHSGDL